MIKLFALCPLQMLLQQAEVELMKNDLTVPKLLYYLQPTIWVIDEIWTTLAEVDLVAYLNIHTLSIHSYNVLVCLA